MAVNCVLRLCKVDIRCRILTKGLAATFSHVVLLKESSVMPSTFIVELRKLLPEGVTSINEASQSPLKFCKCLKLFCLKQFIYSGTIRHVSAELSIVNNDLEHAFPFVSGLPASIECDITLHSITSDHRSWLSMTMNDDGSSQFVFLDWKLLEGSGEERNFAFVAPFYGTPKANPFRLKVRIGLECLFDDAVLGKPVKGLDQDLRFFVLKKRFIFPMY